MMLLEAIYTNSKRQQWVVMEHGLAQDKYDLKA